MLDEEWADRKVVFVLQQLLFVIIGRLHFVCLFIYSFVHSFIHTFILRMVTPGILAYI